MVSVDGGNSWEPFDSSTNIGDADSDVDGTGCVNQGNTTAADIGGFLRTHLHEVCGNCAAGIQKTRKEIGWFYFFFFFIKNG